MLCARNTHTKTGSLAQRRERRQDHEAEEQEDLLVHAAEVQLEHEHERAEEHHIDGGHPNRWYR